MKKSIIFSASITCMLLQLSAMAMQNPTEAAKNNSRSNIREIASNLYSGAVDEQLFLGIERIDQNPERLLAWQTYAHLQYQMGQQQGLDLNGFDHFKMAVDSYASHEILPTNELWILFASNQPITHKIDLSTEQLSIDMFCTVVTSPNACLTTHLGISRSCESFQRPSIRRPFPMSIHLHSFGAKVMRMMDPRKVAFITTPVKLMLDIISKYVPRIAIFVASTPSLHDTLENGFASLHIGNAQELIGPDIERNHQWLFTAPYQPDISRPYAMINLQMLASITPLKE